MFCALLTGFFPAVVGVSAGRCFYEDVWGMRCSDGAGVTARGACITTVLLGRLLEHNFHIPEPIPAAAACPVRCLKSGRLDGRSLFGQCRISSGFLQATTEGFVERQGALEGEALQAQKALSGRVRLALCVQ